MKFNFIREDGQTVEINVTCFIGRYESEAGYLNNLLKAEVEPISFEATRRIFNTCKQHAQQQYDYGREITMDAPNSSTAQAYRRMMREGLRGDDDFDAISRVMDRLVRIQAVPNASITPHPAPRLVTEDVIQQAMARVGQCGVVSVDCDDTVNDVAAILEGSTTRTTNPIRMRMEDSDFYAATDGSTRSLFFMPPTIPRRDKYKWTINLDKVAHAGVTQAALQKEVEALTLEVGFDPSTYLRVNAVLAPEIITRDKFYALIALGANPNQQDYFGRTCLHLILNRFKPESLSAVPKEHQIALLNWLIGAGANPDMPDEDGITPRSLADQKGISFANAIFSSDIKPLNQYGFYGVQATGTTPFQGPRPPSPYSLD